MEKILLQILAFALLWLSTMLGRKEDSRIQLFSIKWWVQVVLIFIASTIFQYMNEWLK
jgi:hypothetical protein